MVGASFAVPGRRVDAEVYCYGRGLHSTSLPFSKVQAFSLETAGTFDLDAELELWFSGLGRDKFEFKGNTDVAYLHKLVGHHVLSGQRRNAGAPRVRRQGSQLEPKAQ